MDYDYDYYPDLCIAIVVLWTILLTRLTSNSGTSLPPGPYGIPILGNLHQLGKAPHRSLHRLAATYGPIMYLKLGSLPTVVISSPHLAKQVLQNNDHLFSSHYQTDTICVHDHQNLSVGFLPVGPKWRNLRKVLNSEIFIQARLDESQSVRLKKVRQMVEHVGENTGRVIDVGFVAFVTMINFLSNTLISVDFADYGSGSSMEFHKMVVRSMELLITPNLSDFFPALRFLDLQGIRRDSHLNMSRLLAIIESIVDRPDQLSNEYRDVLDAVHRKQSEYQLSSMDIRHLFLDLFLAGAHSSSTIVERAMAELLRNPGKMKKAQSETRSVLGDERLVQESDIPKLKYLQAIVKETLRLYPPAPFLIPRKALADVKIDGFMVPEGSQILINIWSIGQDSNIWTDPESFEPERFLNLEIENKGKNFEFIPFGAGRRICPGQPLAHRTVNLVLASLIHSFDWELEKGTKVARKLVPVRAIPTPKFSN